MPADSSPRPTGRERHGWGDPALGLLLLVVDAAVCAVTALLFALRGWDRQAAAQGPGGDGTPPPMDWIPTASFAAVALCVAATGFALTRAGFRYSGAAQLLAAALICLVTVDVGYGDWKQAHPDPAPSCPAVPDAPCRDGAGNDDGR